MRMIQWHRIVLAVCCCLLACCEAVESHLEVAARIQAPAIRECSGIVASRQFNGVFWVLNDSGNAAQLFAIDAQGRLLCEVDVQGASNTDWEDLTVDDAGNLYIGEFGNNHNDRRNLEVLVVREPDPTDCRGASRQITVTRRIPFHFPEQTGYPDKSLMNFDCESIFWLEGSLYVFTKHRSDSRTVLYRLPETGETAAVRLDGFDAKGMVTAASVSDDGKSLVVLTYDHLHLFELEAGVASLQSLGEPDASMVLEMRQCEAVCWDGDTIVVANEQREIYRIPRSPWRPLLLPAVPVAQRMLVEDTAPELVPWGEINPVLMAPEYEQGRMPSSLQPTLRISRSAQALYCQVDYGPPGMAESAEGWFLLVHIGADNNRQVMEQRHEDLEYQVSRRSGNWSVRCRTVLECACEDRQAHDQAHAEAAAVHFDAAAGVLCARLPLDELLVRQPTTTLRVNVIVRRPVGSANDEWAWGGTSSARPAENVLLWGRLECGGERRK